MVELYDYDHVYVCTPPVSFNADAKVPVTVEMKVAPQFEQERQVRIEASLDPEMRSQKAKEFISSKVGKIEGLMVGGVAVTNYDQLRKTGPNELIRWVEVAVFSESALSEAEIKN